MRHTCISAHRGDNPPGGTQEIGAPAGTGVRGRAGRMAYDGERGRNDDAIGVASVPLGGSAGPRHDVLSSTIGEPGAAPARCAPAYADPLGHDSDVFELGKARRAGGDQAGFRLVSQPDAVWAARSSSPSTPRAEARSRPSRATPVSEETAQCTCQPPTLRLGSCI